MKKILALFLLTAAALCAQQINLREHGKLMLYLDDTWKFEVKEVDDQVLVMVTPRGDVNAKCTLAIRYPEEDRLNTKAKLREKVEILGLQLADQSVERKAIPKEFFRRSGYGFYCNFTDPELVRKPPEKDNFKTLSVGLVYLAPDVLVEVGISSDGFKTEAYQLLLGMIEGMEYTPKESPRNTPNTRKG